LLNIQTIFASNKQLSELKDIGFNEAIIYRICQNYFEIPPLRERKEDIAIFINYYIWKNNYKIENDKISQDPDKGCIKYIDLKGLRLLCELKWSDNYRGVKGFINDLLSDRKRRRIHTHEISFEEIFECIKRRKLLS